MRRALFAAAVILALPLAARADGEWLLKQSTLTYHVSHPMHEVTGVSRAARGKGVCQQGTCEFLVAAPAKSFDSGDSNRDLHMLQATRGAEFPMITLRTELPESVLHSAEIRADLEIRELYS